MSVYTPSCVVALIDIDSMYASCERAFNPRLWGKPVVVLSNNDGCVIARSQEARQLGVPMGQPWHEVAADYRFKSVIPCSSNYELYGDVSARMQSIIRGYAAEVAPYSIDECFALLPREHAWDIAKRVQRDMANHLGLPSTIGLGETKTLAKIASVGAKKHAAFHGICSVVGWTETQMNEVLDKMPVAETWGVGRALAKKLPLQGIETVGDLKHMDIAHARRVAGVNLTRSVAELNGERCIDFYEETKNSTTMIFSRLFGKKLTDPAQVCVALTGFAHILTARLRAKGLVAQTFVVRTSTGCANSENPHYPYVTQSVLDPTYSTQDVLNIVKKLEPLLKEGVKYARGEIVAIGLYPVDGQGSLFEDPHHEKFSKLDQVMDALPQGSVTLGTSSLTTGWGMKRQYLSPRYSTHWDELLTVKAAE